MAIIMTLWIANGAVLKSSSQWQLTLSQTSPGFYVYAGKVFLKTLREKEKLLVMSNFSFSRSIFLPVWGTFCHLDRT